MLYNSEFALGVNGWSVNGDVETIMINSSNILRMSSGASIEQDIPMIRNHFGTEKFYVQFDVLTEGNGSVLVECADKEQEVVFNGPGTYTCSFEGLEYNFFKLVAQTEVDIDNIYFYTHVQEGKLYTADDEEDSCISGIRKMNVIIDGLITKQKEEAPYFSFIEEFDEAKIDGKINSTDFLNGANIGLYYDAATSEHAIYITPEVSLEYKFWLDDAPRTLTFSYEFFQQAKNWGSDGVVLEVIVNGELLSTLNITPQDVRKDFSLELSRYVNEKVSIEFKCGQGGNAIGDWLLIYEPKCG